MQIAEAAMKIDTAFLHARRAADDLDRYAQDVAIHGSRRAGARAHGYGAGGQVLPRGRRAPGAAHGTSSLADQQPHAAFWRDVHVASHHAITEWQVNLEVYGKALLGVEPNITHLI